MIRAPGGSVCFMMFLLWFSGEDQKPLDCWFFCHSNCGYFVNQFAKSFALNSVLFGKRPVCIPRYDFANILFCHNIILPKYDYHVAKVLFCHNIILPKYHVAKILFCPNTNFPKYCDAQWSSWVLPKSVARICLQNDRPKSSQITIWVVPKPHMLHNLQGWWSHGTVPCDSYY